MRRDLSFRPPYSQHGLTMLEVLITIVILAFGLLGIAGLQARMQAAEFEAYQRAQALVLLQEMVDRINANRKNSMDYASVAAGTGNSLDCSAPTTISQKDICEWSDSLLGASEKKGTASLGAMIDARGCVTNTVATMPREFVVSVVWQGLTSTAAPTSTTCGQGSYTPDETRRAVVARVTIGCLQNDPTTGLCVTP